MRFRLGGFGPGHAGTMFLIEQNYQVLESRDQDRVCVGPPDRHALRCSGCAVQSLSLLEHFSVISQPTDPAFKFLVLWGVK